MENHLKQIDRKLYAITKLIMLILMYQFKSSPYAAEITEEIRKINEYLGENTRRFIGKDNKE